MKTLYAACISRLGLSQSGAASLHSVGLQSVKNWCSARSQPPPGVWDELRVYEARIVDASEELREAWEAAGSPPIELDDCEANGSALAAAADFVLGSPPGTLVHTGSTAATRLARQARRPN